MDDITITISVNDWRDVQIDGVLRAGIIKAIARAARMAAEDKAELHDVVIKADTTTSVVGG